MEVFQSAKTIRFRTPEQDNFLVRRGVYRKDSKKLQINTSRRKPLESSLKSISTYAYVTETSTPAGKHYGFDEKLQDTDGYLFQSLLQSRLKKKRLKKANESLNEVLVLDDAEDFSADVKRQKNHLIDGMLRDTFANNKVDFYQQYKRFDKLDEFAQKFNYEDKLNHKMLHQFNEKLITPRKYGLVDVQSSRQTPSPKPRHLKPLQKRKSIFKQSSSPKTLYFTNHLMGDSYAEVCAAAFSSDELSDTSSISLNNNRLTYKSIPSLAANLPTQLETLDLSNNPLSTLGCIQMEAILRDYKNLQCLTLQNCKINDHGANILFQQLNRFGYVKRLNFSKNMIGDLACQTLAQVLSRNKNLQELYLHWNCIRIKGGGHLFRELAKNEILKVLDLSFNSLGSLQPSKKSELIDSVKEIGKYLQKPEASLLHLDLSFNQFSHDQIKHLQTCLYLNHSLMGLHVEGNASAYLDINGFIAFNDTDFMLERMTTQQRNIHGVEVQGGIENPLYQRTDNCWICEGWCEVQFSWQMENDERDQMWLHLDFECFQPLLMEKDESGMFYSMKKMCPPLRKVFYFFSNQITMQYHTSQEQAQEDLEGYLHAANLIAVCYLNQDNVSQQVKDLNCLNFVFSNQQQIVDPLLYTLLVDTLPRGKNKRFIDQKSQQRTEKAQDIFRTWSIAVSNFKGFVRDNEDHLDKCFEFDWSMSRIPKWIKLEEEIPLVKRLFRQYYHKTKEIYKIYSAHQTTHTSSGIPQNVFMEMVQNLGLIDGLTLRPQDAEIIFLSINSRDLKFQYKPDKQLARFQMLEVLFRAAEVKNLRPLRTYVESVTKLFDDLQLKFLDIETGQSWREKKFWNQSCDFVLKLRSINLRMIFQYFCAADETKLTLKEFKHCLMAFGVGVTSKQPSPHMSEINDKELAVIFNQSLMTSLDELNYDKHTKMGLLEFQEALARLAEKISPINAQEDPLDFTFQDRQKQPLQVKLENIISFLLNKINDESMKRLVVSPQEKQSFKESASFEDPEDCDFQARSSLFMKLENIGRPSKQYQFQNRRIGIQM